MPRMRDRPAQEIVVLCLTGIVAFVICITIVGVFVVELSNPEVDTTKIISSVVGLTNTIIGGVIGFIAGRGVRQKGEDE